MEEIKINATLNKEGNFYEHFGIHESLVNLYGNKPEDIVELHMKISEDQSIPKKDNNNIPDYWGWYDYEKKEFTLIYAKRFLLDICFPYGIKAYEKNNRGKAYRLIII